MYIIYIYAYTYVYLYKYPSKPPFWSLQSNSNDHGSHMVRARLKNSKERLQLLRHRLHLWPHGIHGFFRDGFFAPLLRIGWKKTNPINTCVHMYLYIYHKYIILYCTYIYMYSIYIVYSVCIYSV